MAPRFNLATLIFRFSASTQNLTANVASAKSALQSLIGSVQGTKAALVGGLTVLGIAAAVAFRKAVVAFAAVDAGLREISTLLPVTAEGLSAVRNELIRISQRTGEPPEILTEAFYQSVSSGFTSAIDSLGIVEQASRAAIAGLTDTATALDAITTVLNSYGLEASEAARVSDILFTTVQEGKLRFDDLAKNIGTVAKTAALSNVSLEEVSALIATLTKNTGQVEESFTAANRLLAAFAKNTDQARAFAKAAGIEFDTFALKQNGLRGVLEAVNAKFGDNIEALARLTPQYRAFRGLAIAASDEGLEQFISSLNRANIAAGATQSALEKISGSLQFQKRILRQEINELWLRLGKEILPIVVDALKEINNLFEDPLDRRIRLLERLGNEEEALYYKRQRLERDFETTVIEAGERRKAIVGEIIESLRQEEQGVLGTTTRPTGVALDPGAQQQAKELGLAEQRVLRALTASRQALLDTQREGISVLEARVNLQQTLISLSQVENLATEKQQAAILTLKDLILDALAATQDQVFNLESLAELAKLTDAELKKLLEEGDERSGLVVLDEDQSKRIADAKALIDSIAQQIIDLEPFQLNPFAELPDTVDDYINQLSTLRERIAELRTAADELETTDPERAASARAYARALEIQLNLLRNQQEAIKDSLKFIEQYGTDVVDLFKSLTDEQRTQVGQQLGFFGEQASLLERIRQEIELTTEGTDARTKAEERYQRVLAQTRQAYQAILISLRSMGLNTEQLAAAQKLFEQALSNAGVSGGGGDETDLSKRWKRIGREMEGVARGVLGIADALGILDDNSRQALEGLVNIGGAVAQIASGNIFGGIAQGIGGIAQLAAGLFGGGPSEEEKRAAEYFQKYGQAIVENSTTLRRLTESVDDLAQTLADFDFRFAREFVASLEGVFEEATGPLSGQRRNSETLRAVENELFNQAFAEYEAFRQKLFASGFVPYQLNFVEALIEYGEQAVERFVNQGLKLSDIEDLAEETGVDLTNVILAFEQFNTTGRIAANTAALAALELEQVSEGIGLLTQNVGDYFNTLAGELKFAEITAEFEDLGNSVEDQIRRLELLREAYRDFGVTAEELAGIDDANLRDALDTIFGADLSTSEGRSALDEALRYIAQNLRNLPPEALGGLSIDEFLQFISELESSLDSLVEAQEEQTDASRSFQVFRGITEITGNRIAGLLTTDTFWNRLTALNTAQIAEALGAEGVKIDEIDMPENVWEEIAANITLIALQNRQLRDIALDVRDLVVRVAQLSTQATDRINTLAIVRAISGTPFDVQAGLDAGPVAEAVENLTIQPQPITDIQPLVDAIRGLTIEPDTLVDIQPLVQAINRITIAAPVVETEELVRALRQLEVNPEPITDIQPLVDVIKNIVIEPTILSDPKSLVDAVNELALQPTVVTDVAPLVEAVEGVEVNTQYEVNVRPLVEAIRNMRLDVSPVVDFDELIFALKQTTIEPETIANFQPLIEAIRGLTIETRLVTDVRPLVDAISNLTIDATVEVSTQELVTAIQQLPIQPRFVVDTQPFAEALSRIQLDIKDALDVSRIVTAIQAIDVDPSQVIDITPLAEAIKGFEIDPTNVFEPGAIIDAIERVNIDVRPEYDVQPLVDAIRALEITNTNEVDLSPLRDAIDLIDISVDPVLDVDPLIEALREFALRIEQVVNRDDLVAAIEKLNIDNAVQFNVRPLVNAIEAVLENEPPTIDTEPIRDAIAGLELKPRIVVNANPIIDAIRRIDIAPESLLDAEAIVRAVRGLELEPRIIVETQELSDAVSGLQLDPHITVNVDPILLAIRDLLTQLRVVADPNDVVSAIEGIDIAPRYETDISPIIEAIQNLAVAAPEVNLTPLAEALLGTSDELRAIADPTALLDAVRALEAQFRPEIDVQPIAEVVNRINEQKLEAGPLINAIRSLEIRPVVIADAEPIVDAIRAYATNSDLVVPITSFIDELRRSVIARPVEPPAEQLLEAFLNATQYAQPMIGTLNVEIAVEYTGQDEEAAQQFGTNVGTSVIDEIDRQMANRYIQTTRATGSPTKRTA